MRHGPGMSRFFKSAAFPILIVVVLAFFAQRLINTGTSEKPPTYSEFLTQLQSGDLKSVVLKTKDNTIVVTQRDGKTYETGYTDGGADRLVGQLRTVGRHKNPGKHETLLAKSWAPRPARTQGYPGKGENANRFRQRAVRQSPRSEAVLPDFGKPTMFQQLQKRKPRRSGVCVYSLAGLLRLQLGAPCGQAK